jgi:uncharacterized protein (DUF983 family)
MRSLLRAAAARCPVCGSKRIWRSFGQLVDACPGCGYRFSREEGYWAGALIVNIAMAMALFFLVFVGGMLLTWPAVPWTGLLIATLLAMAVGPALLYRQSKTLWVWLDQKVHPYVGEERDWERR